MVSTAARVGSINVLLAVQFGQATQGLNTFAGAVERTGQRTQRAVSGIDRSIIGMNRAFAGIGAGSSGFRGLTISALRTRDSIGQLNNMLLATSALMGGLLPTLTGAYFVRMADRAHLLSNNLRTVTTDTADLKQTQEALFDVAQRTRSSFEATATIYARTARATEHLGRSQADLLRMTGTIQKAFAIGGATTAEATGAAIQLSQGIASDRFSGEEFRSVAENAPVLLRGIADSLGVNIGKLREMAHAGELTAKVVTQAIIDASERIDEEFAKTTSTIGQAMVKLDNAILKYVGDSENVSVASMGIVTAIDAVSSNLDTTADALLLLGGTIVSIMAGRPLNAIRQNTAAMGAHLMMTRQAAAASVHQARAEAAAAITRLASARSYYQMVTQGVATEATRVKAARELHAANIQNLASQRALAMATLQHDAALKSASLSGRAYAAAGRAASAAWAFIGGPMGLALMAVGTALYVISSESAKSQAEFSRFASAGDRVVETLARIAGRAKETGDEISRFANGFRDLIRVEGFARARAEFDGLRDSVGDMGRQLAELARQASVASSSVALGVQITSLTSQFRVGSLSAEEFGERLQDIARANPDLSKVIADMIDVAGEADHAKTALAEAERQLIAMDGRTATMNLLINYKEGGVGEKGDRLVPPLSDSEFASRFGWDEYFNFPKERKPRGGGRARKTADDRFDNLLQDLANRTDALRQEREALNLNYAEQLRRQEALKLEQEALAQVREEARRKGEADWQNAQLTPSYISRINEKVSAHVREAMALKQAKESQEAWNEAAGETGGILRGIIDGSVELEDALLQLVPVVLKLINSLNVAGGGPGIFGGGVLQSFIGGLLGVSFHRGGTVGKGGNVVQFPSGAPYVGTFHGGGNFGGRRAKHDEVLALVQEHENIFTSRNTDRISAALGDSVSSLAEKSSVYAPVYQIDARGADAAAVARLEAALKERDRRFGQMVDQRVDERQKRRTRG